MLQAASATLASVQMLLASGATQANYSLNAPVYEAAKKALVWTLSAGTFAKDKLRINLSGQLADLAGNALDGEWTDSVSGPASGNGSPGGDFRFRFNVLPGDWNQSGQVQANDWGFARSKLLDVLPEDEPLLPDLL